MAVCCGRDFCHPLLREAGLNQYLRENLTSPGEARLGLSRPEGSCACEWRLQRWAWSDRRCPEHSAHPVARLFQLSAVPAPPSLKVLRGQLRGQWFRHWELTLSSGLKASLGLIVIGSTAGQSGAT